MERSTTIYDLPLEIVEYIANINRDTTIFSSLALAYKPFSQYALTHQAKYVSRFLNQKQKDKWLITWVRENNIKKVKILLNCGTNVHVKSSSGLKDFPLLIAANNGYKDMVQLLFDKGADNYNEAMASAARSGHVDIVQLMLKKGANDYNKAIKWAALGGHKEIVRLMLKLGTNRFYRATAMNQACRKNHVEIVKLLLEKDATDYNSAMKETDYNGAMTYAAESGHIDIVRLMLKLGAKDYNGAMAWAAGSGHMEIVELMLKLGAKNYNKSMAYAAFGGHMEIVELMLLYGAEDYNWALDLAGKGDNLDIVRFFQTYKEKATT